jgi:Immunoglobulin I-set domain
LINRLTLSDPLAIDQLSKSETVKENGEVSFKCKTNGVPTATLKWYFDDSELGENINLD